MAPTIDPTELRDHLTPLDESAVAHPNGAIKKQYSLGTAAAKQRRVAHEVDAGAKCLVPGVECEGFELHFWRKRCKNCGYSREDHDVQLMPGVYRPYRRLIGAEEAAVEEEEEEEVATEEEIAEQEPEPEPEQEPEQVQEPEVAPEPVKPPKKKRTREQLVRLAHQDPAHDHDLGACSHLGDPNNHNENQIKSFELLSQKRNEMYGVGQPERYRGEGDSCGRTDEPIAANDMIIDVPEINKKFKEDNFTCKNCKEELCEFKHYVHEGDVYCGRCHAEFFMPRCAGCDELIFDATYTLAENKKWHTVHFCCWVCDTDLCEKQYAKDPDENPTCLECYNEKYAKKCGTCAQPISAGQKAMRAGETSYHHDDECFSCSKCCCALEGQKCVDHEGALFCSPCFYEQHTPPCGRCGERVTGDYVEVKGKRYMKSCFNCYECGAQFTHEHKKGAFPVDDKLLCYTHALEARRAQRQLAKDSKAREEAEVAASSSESPESPEPEVEPAPPARAGSMRPHALELTAAPDQKSFVRKGTRQITRIQTQPRESRRALTAAEKEAMARAVAAAEHAASESDADAGADADTSSGEEEGDDDHGSELQAPAATSASTSTSRAPSPARSPAAAPQAPPASAPAGDALRTSRPGTPTTLGGSAPEFGSVYDSPAAVSVATEPGVPLATVLPRAQSSVSPSPEATPIGSHGLSEDTFAALFAGFSIPMKLAKFKLNIPGREILQVGTFTLMEKKASFLVYLVLCTDVGFLCQKIDDNCYELMYMPVQRNKIKAKLAKGDSRVVGMKVKVGKSVLLKCADEVQRSQWIGVLNAPIGFTPTKALDCVSG